MSTVREVQVTFDCADPARLAAFWCEALGYESPPGDAEPGSAWAACVDPSGRGPRLFFQRVPEGKVVKNRVHLDVRAVRGRVGEERLAALRAESARLVALGASELRLLPADGEDESCQVMRDPEGNEFCLD
ncbi:VOC family protein [Clavibacter phaseoli]|jgi:hypothetical protein|uniref:VOC family protein n=1 Tax=Clavibacter phaseoli TaxID=1734031 RepID=UPI000E66DB37|nr:VOC family protein [Clavibacter phaseoli]MCJ1711957.1 VOC family protein [Clavibacter phaseoli]RIJ60122.1 VOC family protein [Clavibacter phaseoli]